MDNAKKTVTVFNIQRYSLHDGGGIRTTVFLKGCPMRCRWCCNPESQSFLNEIMYSHGKCIGKHECRACVDVCKNGLISFGNDGKAIVLPQINKCSGCLSCAEVCPSRAIKIEGREMTVESIIDEAEKDAFFYKSGGGGITLSGGEPLAQPNSIELLMTAKKRYLNTSIETCGNVSENVLLSAAQYLDEIYYDIKSLNDEKHIGYTGCSNKKIISNLTALCEKFPDIPKTVRNPVIPGFNDDDDSLRAIERFVESLPGNVKWEKLPYHTYGANKYAMLGRKYEMQVK